MKRILILMLIAKFLYWIPFGKSWYHKLFIIMKQRYGKKILIKKVSFVNFHSFVFKGILIKDTNTNRMYNIGKLEVRIVMRYLIYGSIKLRSVISNNLSAQVLTIPNNFVPKSIPNGKIWTAQINADYLHRIYCRISSFWPKNVDLRLYNTKIIYERNKALTIHTLLFNDSYFSLDFSLKNNSKSSRYAFKGLYSFNNLNCLNITISPINSPSGSVGQKGDTNPKFQNITIDLLSDSTNSNQFTFHFEVKQVEFSENMISKKKIKIRTINGKFFLKTNSRQFIVDKESFINVNNLRFALRFYLDQSSDLHTFAIQPILKTSKVKDLLDIFSTIEYHDFIKECLSGAISVIISLKFHLDNPFNYLFDIEVKHNLSLAFKNNFTGFNYLRYPFAHSVFEEGQLIKQISLHLDNELYCPISDISDILKKIIILTEDRNFFSHKGFDKGGVGLAIISNIVEKKFTRGASTITMQLIRNLFLNHEKNVFRKIDEIFLTWVLEEVDRIPKERLFEIYLNILEFGPGIYGVVEASEFYFSKKTNTLNLLECLVLSYILPRPKYFLEAVLIKSHQLERNLKSHIERYSDEAFKKSYIVESDRITFPLTIKFSKAIGCVEIS